MSPTMDIAESPSIEEDIGCKTTMESSSTLVTNPGQSDTVFSRPSATLSSDSDIDIKSCAQGDNNKSSGRLIRSVTDKIPGFRTQRSSSGRALRMSVREEDGLHKSSPLLSSNRSRKFSVQIPTRLSTKGPPGGLHDNLSVAEDPLDYVSPSTITSSGPTSGCGGLAARRQIKIDLSLPAGLPDMSKAGDRKGMYPATLSSITPSRPRSPQTPFVSDVELGWGHDVDYRTSKSAPILEEGPAPTNNADSTSPSQPIIEPDLQFELALGVAPLDSPLFIRPPRKIRDRCYISRPNKRNHQSSGYNTSDSDFTSTLGGNWTPEPSDEATGHDASLQRELFQLAKASKSTRARRWPWKKAKTSTPRTQAEKGQTDRRKSIAINIFKRSDHVAEVSERGAKEKKLNRLVGVPWRREKTVNKPPLPSATLAKMSVPPVFVPPGCEKVPMPPVFDSDRDVRGKLADFFFDTDRFPQSKRRQEPSPGGYWDSNAVLMSMHTDLRLTNDEDEEGPEGRPMPTPFHFGPINDTPGLVMSPETQTGADSYLAVKPFHKSPLSSTPGLQDSWFRMHYSDDTPERGLTAAALKEADERRKFEWLIPEHLPNSPVCPLHIKYVGPSKGLCYWHGKKCDGWGVEPGRDYITDPMRIGQGNTRGWEVGEIPRLKEEPTRRRRLESFIDAS